MSRVAELVGAEERVHAADVERRPFRMVLRRLAGKNFDNVHAILSSCARGSPDGAVDVALLCGLLHDLKEGEAAWHELWRVLRLEGSLSVSEHHVRRQAMMMCLTGTGVYELPRQGEFALVPQGESRFESVLDRSSGGLAPNGGATEVTCATSNCTRCSWVSFSLPLVF
ncbi:MAG: methyltransferase domain-containing protein [Calditrichaeota bacterium]|nr:methyltransferase domain-containing protein [Calditrichota bacterium]